MEKKSTITDKLSRPIKDLRISVTDRCNFRCTYCMPEQIYGHKYQFINKSSLLNFEEIITITEILVEMGVQKVRLTGGEPLLRDKIEDLVFDLSKISGIKELTLTTNGYLLPQKAQKLRDSGLDRITVSLDSLNNEIFKKVNGRNIDVSKVLKGIEAAEKAGFMPIKINCVVEKGINENSIIDMAEYFKAKGHILRFIEFMDVGTLNKWNLNKVVSAKEIVQIINSKMPIRPIAPTYFGEVASRYQYKDGSGEIGIIASVTQPFCGNCTRLRLSPEGSLYTCLFSNTGTDMKKILRSSNGQDLRSLIKKTWQTRTDKYSIDRSSNINKSTKKVEMYHIGG
ncbi:MAG: GTP 3',8-cyclase MoaA [SAR202 cluster bacterium]|nr:GTP 3',8-cyclase MoaA [SAR202 cluster bacterium]